ncbi:MAG: hypothetical protein ACR2PA_20145 [Hyphomicrobiaceae bacterium]
MIFSTSHANRLALPALLALSHFLVVSQQADAGDYYHACRSVDGQYVMQDESLQTAADEQAGRSRSIKYRTLKKIWLEKSRGYCTSRGQRFNFGASKYVIDISFQDNGQRITTSMLCELAASGLPAAYPCEKEVVSLDWKLSPQQPPADSADDGNQPAPAPTGGTLWLHNRSVMRLVADGPRRSFVYDKPRQGLLDRGVQSGDVLFEGRRRGKTYSGTAYIFTRSCGRVGYAVPGSVQNSDRRVVMVGSAPRLNDSCQQIGSREDRLVFSLR